MSVPEYDNIAKWAALFRRMPLWLKAIVVVSTISIASIWVYMQFGPIRQLQSENARLQSELAATDRKANDLKDKKDELHRENLYYKTLVTTIQKKAEELYPELESAAALAKLAEDIQTVRSLATKDLYKPLDPSHSDALVQKLAEIRLRYLNPPNLVMAVEQGNSSRMRVASDLKGFFDRAGFTTKIRPQQTFRTGVPPDVRVTLNPANLQFVQELVDAVGQGYINKKIAGAKDDKLGVDEIVIEINGDPLFSDTGIVTFR
jgi:hypothetical protein